MKENGKLIRNYYIQYNCLGETKKRLEEMAENGWMLEEISGRTKFIFKKCEPKKLRFSVNIFPEGSEYDTHAGEANFEYNEFCKDAGWDFVCSSGPVHIFVTENEDAEDIDSDPAVELKTIFKFVKPNIYIGFAMSVIAIITIVYSLTINLNRTLMSFIPFFSLFIWGTVLILWIFKITGYFSWYRKAKKAAENGEKLPEGRKMSYRTAMLSLSVFAAVMFIILLWAGSRFSEPMCFYMIPILSVIYLALFAWKKIMQLSEKKKFGKTAMQMITFIGVPAVTVLLVNVIMISVFFKIDHDSKGNADIISDTSVFSADSSDISRFEQKKTDFGSFIISQYNYYLRGYNDQELSDEWNFCIFETSMPSVYSRLIKDIENNKFRAFSIYYDMKNAVRSEGLNFEGVSVYECKDTNGVYYLIYDDDTILTCRCSSELTSDQFDVICSDIVMQ